MTAILDVSKKQAVRYAIPNWLRDEQIKTAIVRKLPRIQPEDRKTEPVAVVGYGPSLNETWEKIKDFKYVISCSGAHRFLIDKGIVPNYHVEVDPREHKILLLGEPHKDVTYLIASACHPKYFDHLEGYNVKLWHVFDATDEGRRLLPRGEWAITGGCDVGLRALTVAGFLGFRDVHVFGLDGSAKEDGRHAGEHPNGGNPKKYATTEYEGVTYKTTPAMLEAARQVKHEMEQMPAVKATFYGEGLIQHMMRGYEAKGGEDSPLSNMLAFANPELISAQYVELNRQLHRENLAYGVGGGKHAEMVLKIANAIKTTSVLDYGCGKGYLAKAIPFPIWEYDPAIPGKEESPRPADFCVCSDVLEHIEPDRLFYVLDDLRRVTRKVGYFVIHTKAAQKVLADGRNAHLIQRGEKWWTGTLKKFFTIGKVWKAGPEMHVVVGKR